MDKTSYVFHLLGIALILQLHMEVYAYKRKRTRQLGQANESKGN